MQTKSEPKEIEVQEHKSTLPSTAKTSDWIRHQAKGEGTEAWLDEPRQQ